MRLNDRVTYQGSALTVEHFEDQLGRSGTVVQLESDYCVVEMDDGAVIDGIVSEFDGPDGSDRQSLSAYLAECARAAEKDRRYERSSGRRSGPDGPVRTFPRR